MSTTSQAFQQLPGQQIKLPIILGDGSAIYLKQDKDKKIRIIKYFQVVDEILDTENIRDLLTNS